jgi:cell division protein FtsN
MAHRSQGGTFAGLLAGILIGLGTALAVAIFVTKAPVPFLNKTARAPERALDPKTPETAPDPNKPLFSRSRADASASAAPETSVLLPGPDRNVPVPAEPTNPEPSAERREGERSVTEARAPAPIEAARPSTQAMPQGGVASMPPAVTQAPNPVAPAPARAPAAAQGAAVAPPAAAPAPAPGAGGEGYVLQAGAFRTVDDAEAMRGRLALLGFEARVIGSEVNGLAVQRVRIGPFTRMEDMNRARTKLTESGIEVSVVRVR